MDNHIECIGYFMGERIVNGVEYSVIDTDDITNTHPDYHHLFIHTESFYPLKKYDTLFFKGKIIEQLGEGVIVDFVDYVEFDNE